MTKEETKAIVDKVQLHRQAFFITNAVYQEWHRILESYDYEDVDKKLDEYFQNGENFGRYPDAYYLTRYLKKHDEKLKVGVNYVRCQNCQQTVELNEYDRHFDRCNSVGYLCDMSEKYYQKHLDKEKLFKMTNEDFKKGYWSFCEKLCEVIDEGLLKRVLKNSILTHNGFNPELGVVDLMKEVRCSR